MKKSLMIGMFAGFVGLQASEEITITPKRIARHEMAIAISDEIIKKALSNSPVGIATDFENESQSRNYDLELVAIDTQSKADRKFEKELFVFRTQAQATFFAIERGCGYDLVQAFVNKAISHSPSPAITEDFKNEVTNVFKLYSPLAISIKEEQNNGSRKSDQRYSLLKLSKKIEALSGVYNNNSVSQARLDVIEKAFHAIKKIKN